ncbi:hypothetical protein KXQ82_13900 [Mucilaginibacter sp. HMF5004]|uniref:hypothetical protein n=1 Tax=Mucilaginibacter rivuli TaxID=2857527 RepID=UPI001C5CC82D|nr:hypothetical protein [Mucilaginibacter rivuli]MBW4890820.1 hypothetical protein [Mucilaginibacter rivuli]
MKYAFTLLFLMTVYQGFAQVSGDGRIPKQHNPKAEQRKVDHPFREAKIADKLKRAQDYKVAFMNKQLDLTPAQNEKFWPLYKQYLDELTAAQIEKRQNNLNPQSNSADKADEIDLKITTLKIKYRGEFRKILPPEKVIQLYKSEQEFNDEVLKRLRGDKKDDPANE